MNAVEFTAELTDSSTLQIPAEAAAQLPKAGRARVIVLTAYDADERIVSVVTAGAKGYLLKGAPREEIFQAIRTVHEGGSLLQPIVASKLMQHLSGQAAQAEDAIDLTPREIEVLQLMAQGHSNKRIAAELVITERTTKFHVSSILAKLDARNRTELKKTTAVKTFD